MKRAAIYARVSTLHQSETSIDTQINECKRFCKSHSMEVIDIFHDKESGAKADRTQFSQMIENALNGKYDVIVVDKFDRFFRNDVEDRIITRQLESKGVFVLSATEGVDVSSPTGRLMRWMISDINAFYRDNLRSEIMRKTIEVVKRGYWVGGIPAYGYKTVEVKDKEGRKRKKVIINEEEASIVRMIFEMADQKISYTNIALTLNKKGFRTRKDKIWSSTSIWEILHNEVYDGTLIYNKGRKGAPHAKRNDTIYIKGAIPAIVPKELFDRVRAKFRTLKNIHNGHYTHPLKGLVKCGDCGANMVVQGEKYVCSAFKAGHPVKYVGMSERKILNFVVGYIDTEILGEPSEEDFIKLAREASKKALKHDQNLKSQIQKLINQRDEIQRELDNIVEAIAKGILTTRLQRKAEKLEVELQKIKYQINQARNNAMMTVTPKELKAKWQQLKEGLRKKETQEEVIHNLIKAIIVYPSKFIKVVPR